MTRSTWNERAVPILEAVNAAHEAGGNELDLRGLREQLGLEMEVFANEIQRLYDSGYIGGHLINAWQQKMIRYRNPQLLERGARVIGVWPNENPFDSLLSLVEDRINSTDDEDERTRLRRFLEGLGGVGREVGTSLLSAWAKGQLGL